MANFEIKRDVQPARDRLSVTFEGEHARVFIGEGVNVTLRKSNNTIWLPLQDVGAMAAALTWVEVKLRELPPEIRRELKLDK